MLRQAQYNEHEIEFIENGFLNGFNLCYQGDREVRCFSNNLKLRCGDKFDLWAKLMKEVSLGRYAGPFKEVLFEYFIQSPIGLVPKQDGDVRLIFHLSYPKNGDSVNSMTPRDLCRVKYHDFDEAIRLCLRLGRNCFVGKTDMKSAFRNVPVRREDWPLMVMKAYHPVTGELLYFVDKCMAFGHSLSCAIYQRISDGIAHLFRYRTKEDTVNYLDDHFFAAILRALCNGLMDAFMQLCEEINFPVSLGTISWYTNRYKVRDHRYSFGKEE